MFFTEKRKVLSQNNNLKTIGVQFTTKGAYMIPFFSLVTSPIFVSQ